MPAATVLAIDTATEYCSVALLMADRVFEASESVGQRHSQLALPLVDQVLRDAGIRLAEVDVIAFGAGPGSFTGLRIACGIAQGLAYGAGKRVVAVGNLRALAARAFALVETAELVLTAIDARMNEAYCAVYRRGDAVEIRRPALASAAGAVELAHKCEVDVVAGNALTAFADAWRQAGGRWRELPELRADALDLARLARIDFAAGLAVDPADAAPLYVRDRVAFTSDERRARAQQP
jgi:tRNA threonylcarbamoyladenosine biosynthesis protein TsaB